MPGRRRPVETAEVRFGWLHDRQAALPYAALGDPPTGLCDARRSRAPPAVPTLSSLKLLPGERHGQVLHRLAARHSGRRSGRRVSDQPPLTRSCHRASDRRARSGRSRPPWPSRLRRATAWRLEGSWLSPRTPASIRPHAAETASRATKPSGCRATSRSRSSAARRARQIPSRSPSRKVDRFSPARSGTRHRSSGVTNP